MIYLIYVVILAHDITILIELDNMLTLKYLVKQFPGIYQISDLEVKIIDDNGDYLPDPNNIITPDQLSRFNRY